MWVYRRRRRLVLGDALVTTNKGESIVFDADGDADADASRVARRGAAFVIQTHALARHGDGVRTVSYTHLTLPTKRIV